MPNTKGNELEVLLRNYPELAICKNAVLTAFNLMLGCYTKGGTIMVCGNGGSAADAEHMAGELMKGFKNKRPLSNRQRDMLLSANPEEGIYLAENLQQAIPAISLASQSALFTAFINDVCPDMVFAQQVFGYGKAGDVLFAISTSGNSANVVHACKVARSFGIKTIGLTGELGGKLREACDVTICVPARETFRIQEYHLPVYHTLCAMVEQDAFGQP